MELPPFVRAMVPPDWPAVRAIYEEGIATGDATFQLKPPSWDEWDAAHVKSCRLVGGESDTILGFAALSPVSERCVYAGVAEVSVYIATRARGRGLGKLLLAELVTVSEADNIWTLQAGVFPENSTSLAIHEKSGFRVVGRREKLGQLNGRWRDVVLLERRSKTVGVTR